MLKSRVILVSLIVLSIAAILMTSSCDLFNKPPEINSLTSSVISVSPGGNCTVTCTASDPDGDNLTYQWDATGGAISGVGRTITWTAPADIGSYDVRVIVNDGHNNTTTDTIAILVVFTPPASMGIIPIG